MSRHPNGSTTYAKKLMRMVYVRRPCRWLLPLILALGVPGLGRAELPQPSCVFYGEARDEYGSPYTTNAQVVLRVQGVECSRWTIMGMLAPGVNFKLPL